MDNKVFIYRIVCGLLLLQHFILLQMCEAIPLSFVSLCRDTLVHELNSEIK
jgi:hypothetical protein